MDKIRNYEDVRREVQDTINYYDGLIKMWEAVSFPTKKDGSPFKVLSKNFEGAKIGAYVPVEDWSSPYLTVYGYVERFGSSGNTYQSYESDHMAT